MTKRDVPAPADGVGAEFELHLEAFLHALAAVRYREATQEGKRRTIERFLRWTRDTGLAAVAFDEDLGSGTGLTDSTCQPLVAHLQTVSSEPPACATFRVVHASRNWATSSALSAWCRRDGRCS